MFSRILVPLDGSPLAECILPHAELFARIFDASIVLLHVLDPTSFQEMPNAVDPLRWQLRKAEADAYLQGIAQRVRTNLYTRDSDDDENFDERVTYSIREGKTAENIVDFAHTQDIDLLVISTHGAGGLSRWNMSSVAHKVINMIYLPILIVRAFSPSPIKDGKVHYRRILLPIDSSRRAECSLSAGIELARGEHRTTDEGASPSSDSVLYLAAVIRLPELPIPKPFPLEINELSDNILRLSREAVDHYMADMRLRLPVVCDSCVVEHISVPNAIQELAEQEEIDIVVLCAHGYSGQINWPYGTVTRTYIEHGTKPVLIIQDVQHTQVKPSAAEIAAERAGSR